MNGQDKKYDEMVRIQTENSEMKWKIKWIGMRGSAVKRTKPRWKLYSMKSWNQGKKRKEETEDKID